MRFAGRVPEEQQIASLEVQVGEARRCIAALGWTLGPDHVFIEDAICRTKGPRRSLAFEDLKLSEMSAWKRMRSLFGHAGPVPPAQPGDQRAPKQKRLPF